MTPRSNHELKFGWLIERQTADFGFALSTMYGPLGVGIQPGMQLDRLIEVARSGTSLAAYLSVTSELTEAVTVRYGVRLSLTRTWKTGIRLRADAYVRQIDNPWRRFDNLYNPRVLLPELHADRYEVTPSIAATLEDTNIN